MNKSMFYKRIKLKKKAVLISFFNSSNIGDRLICSEIERRLSSHYELICYDYSTMNKVDRPLGVHQPASFSRLKVLQGYIKCHPLALRMLRFFKINSWLRFYRELIFTCSLRKFSHNLQEVETVLFGGGNMIMDFQAKNWMVNLGKIIKVIKSGHKAYSFLYIGVGPFESQDNITRARSIIDSSEVVIVRDESSADLCRAIGVGKAILTAVDPVLGLDRNIEYDRDGMIGICLLSELCLSMQGYNAYYKLVNTTARELLRIGEQIYFFSTEIIDYRESTSLDEDILRRSTIIYISEYEELEDLYRKTKFLVLGRMHAMIIAQALEIPYTGFAWQAKIEGFWRTIESNLVLIDPCGESSFIDHAPETIVEQIRKREELKTGMRIVNDAIRSRLDKSFQDFISR